MPIALYVLKRILLAVPTILAVSIIGFLLMRFHFTVGPWDIPLGKHTVHVLDKTEIKNPIDPLAQLRNNPQISPQALQKEEERIGINKPMLQQYGLWLGHVLRFDTSALKQGRLWAFYQPDLGKTFTGDDVAELLLSRAGNTLLLNLSSLAITWLVALPLGIYAAVRWRSVFDRLLTLFSAVGMAMPSFVLALLLAVFAVKSGWLPLGGLRSHNYEEMSVLGQGWDILRHLALPVFVLSFGGVASLQRQMRGNLLDVLQAEYVRTARAKGLPENVVLYKHAVRTAINPLITMMGYEIAALLSGTVLIETVLGYPGLGALTYQAAIQGDTNLVMASLVMSAMMLVLGNLVADIVLKAVDPRVELA